MEKSDSNLHCTLLSAKCLFSPAEVNIHRKICQDHTPQSLETQQVLNELCEEYKYIFSLHQGKL